MLKNRHGEWMLLPALPQYRIFHRGKHQLKLQIALCRHRLVVPKYNPARTFTPEGAVGIGGSYMCIYPMQSPGGYQLVGQTLPIWNTFGRAGPFTPQKPWLLRMFDQAGCACSAPSSDHANLNSCVYDTQAMTRL